MLIYSSTYMSLNKTSTKYKQILFWFLVFLFSSNVVLADSKNREPFQAIEQKNNIVKSMLIRLYHADALQVVKMIRKGQSKEGLLSKTGNVVVDKSINAIWVSDFEDRLKIIRSFISQVDLPVKQILLKAYIVNADQNFTRDVGLDFSEYQASDNLLPKPRLIFQKNKLNIAVANLGPIASLEIALTALENQGRGRVLSNPRLVTSSGKTAYIGSGDEIPYQERTSQGNTNVAFKKAVLSLEVTPQLLPENTIVLDLVVHQDKISSLLVNGVPAIHTQEVRTQVRVKDGQTVVLGGIIEYVNSEQFINIAGLSKLPLVGGLFRHKVSKKDRRELLIFITPSAVS